PWDTVHHGNFCAVGYHNPKREKVSGSMGSNPPTATIFTPKKQSHFCRQREAASSVGDISVRFLLAAA
ncbi:hypothetical protein ACK3YN_12510, partial [Aeromonas caviae]